MTLNRWTPSGSDGDTLTTIAGKVDQVSTQTASATVKLRTAAGASRGNNIGVECVTGATASDVANFYVPATVTSDLAGTGQFWYQVPTLVDIGTGNAYLEFCRWRSGTTGSGTNLNRLMIASYDHATVTPGTVIAQNSGGTAISGNTPIALAAGSWYRIELGVKPATTTTGASEARIYDNSDSLLWQLNHAAADLNVGTAVPTRFGLGKVAGTGSNCKWRYAVPATDTGSTMPTIATVALNAALTISLSLNPTHGPVPRGDGTNGTVVTYTITPTGGNGNPITYAIDYGDGAGVSAYQSSPVFTRTPPAPGGTYPQTQNVTPYARQDV